MKKKIITIQIFCMSFIAVSVLVLAISSGKIPELAMRSMAYLIAVAFFFPSFYLALNRSDVSKLTKYCLILAAGFFFTFIVYDILRYIFLTSI